MWTVNLAGAVVAGVGALAASTSFFGVVVALAWLTFATTAAITTGVGVRVLRRRLLTWSQQATLWLIAFALCGLLASAISAGVGALTDVGGGAPMLWSIWVFATPLLGGYLALSAVTGRRTTATRTPPQA